MSDPANSRSKSPDFSVRGKWQNSAHKCQKGLKVERPGELTKVLKRLKEPSYLNYTAVKNYLREADQDCVEDFMERDGLFLLLEGLGAMSAQKMKIDDVATVVECVNCIRQLMNSEAGMNFLVRNKQEAASQQLAVVLSGANTTAKNQVFELLGAICAYSSQGCGLVHECMQKHQEQKKSPGLLYETVAELRAASDRCSLDYATVILAFVNCFLLSSKKYSKHIDLLQDLKLGSFNELVPSLSALPSPSLQLQVKSLLDTLDECVITAAESAVAHTFSQLGSSNLQLVYTDFLGKLANQMEDPLKRPNLMKKLQHFFDSVESKIADDDTSNPISFSKNDPIATVIVSRIHGDSRSDNGKPAELNVKTKSLPETVKAAAIPPPPPPAPRMPPPPPPPSTRLPVPNSGPLPKPVRWNKIATTAERLTNSVWKKDGIKKLKRVDSKKLRSLFVESSSRRGSVGPVLSRSESPSIELIDSKRSLKINVWLKQFRDTSEKQHADRVATVDTESYDSDDLSGLLGILPTLEEIAIFKTISAKKDLDELGHAEKILYYLSQISDCSLRVEVMRNKKDLKSGVDIYRSDFMEIIGHCNTILQSKKLQTFLQFVLQVGNILNENRNEYGNASAVKLNGLLKLSETASSDPKISLLHFVIQEIQQQDPETLTFCNDFASLPRACRFQTDNLRSEYLTFRCKYEELRDRVDGSKSDLKGKTEIFFKDADTQLSELEQLYNNMDMKIKELAEYFLEEPNKNLFENSIKDICTFVNQVNAVQQDIIKRQKDFSTPPSKDPSSMNLQGSRTLPRSFARKSDLSVMASMNMTSDDLKDGVLKELLMGIKTGSPLPRRQRL